MWFIGLVLGIAVGAAFQSFPAVLFCAIIGSIVFHRGVRWPAKRAAAAAVDDDAVGALKERIDALERRVKTLERSANGALNADEAAPTPIAETAIDSLPDPDLDPTAEAASIGDIELPLEPVGIAPATVALPMPEPLAIAAAMSIDPANADAAPMPPADSFAPSTPRAAPPRTPATPRLPLRERLPAPIAALVFGGNTLVKLGVLILFLGLAFLLRYTAERVTVPIELRYAGVAAIGAVLLSLGWVLRRRRAVYALVLQGAGIGVFYLTTLSAMKLHALLPPEAGFAFLFAVAVLAALLAVLQNAPVLAIVAALEGFAAPVLASTGANRPVALFSYLLVLDIGIVLVAWFKAWRALNLIGLVGTFTLAAGWADRYYSDAQYGVVQPFLIVFFLLFTLIGLLFARRTLFDAPADEDRSLGERAGAALKRVGRVDSSLVFGVPMAAFALQYLLMRPWPYGAAFSALALGFVYLALGRIVHATQPRGLALLAEAYAIVGVIFGTLAIPLGLEGQWTGATWAVEAAGMYWLGIRQQRPYARAFALVLVAGAVVQLLRAVTLVDREDGALLQGSVIGPLMLATGVFAIWALHRRAKLDAGAGWEALAGAALPWIGMGSLVLLPWQWLVPMWAATATSLLALAAWFIALRFGLAPLKAVVHAMQLLAVVGFVATLHRGLDGGAALAGARAGGIAAVLLALSVLATAAWAMRSAYRAALASGVAPRWSAVQIVGVVGGVALLHLASLLGVDLAHAAFIWPFTALIVLWVALRLAHPPLAMLACVLHGVAALFGLWALGAHAYAEPPPPAFAHLGFCTALALAVTALTGADWLRNEAAHVALRTDEVPLKRWVNAWCAQPAVLWLSVLWGLLWWLVASLGEGTRVLSVDERLVFEPALIVAIVLGTSLIGSMLAARRSWRQLGLAMTATLPGFVFAALVGAALGVSGGSWLPYLPSTALGWLAWPLALGWHLRLLRMQQRWSSPQALSGLHVAGLWFFVLLAARECQWRFAGFGDDLASWPLLGWVLVPVLVLWALRSRALLQRWPLTEYRRAYLEIALSPIAVYLFGWLWITNIVSAGDAAPLPYVPLLNPLELAQGLVLIALALWWRALPASCAWRPSTPAAMRTAAVTGWVLLTGMVLRACHHYAEVPWRADVLYDSRLTQAALSIAWALCGMLAMVLGHRRGSRVVWIGGAVLLGIVVVKLFLVELADQGGLFRIVSFVGVGMLLLVVGYFAPVPPAVASAEERMA